MGRRVVVTGLGLVTPLGNQLQQVWYRLLQGQSAIVSTPFNAKSKVAALVPRTDQQGVTIAQQAGLTAADVSVMPDFVQFAVLAAKNAIEDAGLNYASWDAEKCGVAIGTGIGSLMDIAESYEKLQTGGARKISPYFVPRILCNMAAGHVSMKFNLKGPNHAVSTACATGAHAIGDAYRFIKDGYADLMIAGGTESSINELSVAGFSRCQALSSRFNDAPSKASRPFDAQRDGFVIGEGAGVLVLEELEAAIRRTGKLDFYAEVLGYGLSGDAFHMTAPDPNGSGAIRAMELALRGLDRKEVGYVNAHATSTPMGDALEACAISKVFEGQNIMVSSTKGAIGHLLGAAGAVEAIFAIQSLRHQELPYNLNLEELDVSQNMDNVDFVRGSSRKVSELKKVMTNSFGFGGTNASLVFGGINNI